MREFQVRVKVARQRLIDQYMQYYQFAMMFGIDPSTDQSLSQTFQQISSQLSVPTYIGGQVLEDITNDFIIRQYARANGIDVTEQDVEQAIREAFGIFPDGTPEPEITSTPVAYSTLSATQIALVTPTLTLTPAPSRTPLPTNTPDLTATPTSIPSITPTATAYTLEGFQDKYSEALAYYTELGMNEADFRRLFFENALYRERVLEVITQDVPNSSEQVWARHILVTDQALANDIYTQLANGADFTLLAAQYSTDGTKDSGGDLGWFGTGKMVAEFETAAFSLQVGEISQPVQSSFGWHIIQALGHENRPLTEEEYKNAREAAFAAWLEVQRAAAEIVISDIWVDNVPEKPDLADTFTSLYATQTAIAPTYEAQQNP
jgi:parvulin-like peptidyl-prolyl isomerase